MFSTTAATTTSTSHQSRVHIHHYVATNNAAASAIDQGRYHDAIYGFSASLSSSKDLLAQLSRCQSSSDCYSQQQQQQQQHCQKTLPELSLDQCMQAGCHLRRDLQHQQANSLPGSGFVYSSPIRLPANLSPSRRSGMLISIISIFNLGVAYHLAALQGQWDQQAYAMMAKSTQLYELAYTLMEREKMDKGASFFSMATINNLGLIHRAFGQNEKADKCFEHLLSTVLSLAHRGQSASRRLSPTQLEGYLQNTSYLISMNECAPAA